MVKGNKDVNEVKLQKLLKANTIVLADQSAVETATNAKVGFAGPIGLAMTLIMDEEIKTMRNFVVGANKTDYHYINVNIEDFTPTMVADIRLIQEDDLCFNCKGHIHFEKGIEIGNTFKLGTKYAKAMDLQYLDQNNQLQDVWMGSYGIGPGRCMAAIAEQNNDDKGLIWPMSIAPYQVGIVIINTKEEKQVQVGSALYDQLQKLGIEVILDDREERAGVKFNDMDLIGIPIRITIGKTLADNKVELKLRNETELKLIDLNEIIDFIKELVN